MDDKAALEDIRNGGQEGKKFLRKRYEEELGERAKTFLPLPKIANHVVQKVWVKLEIDCRFETDFQPENSLKTWLYRSLDNAIDEMALQYILEGNGYQQKLGYRALYKHYATSVHSYVRNKGIPDRDIDDVVLEVFHKFFQNIHNFKRECSISTWLFRYVVTSVVQDYWRRTKRPEIPLDENETDNGYDTKKNILNKCLKQVEASLEREGNSELLQCLQAYKMKQAGYSLKEIATELGRTYDAIRQWITTTCLKNLKQYVPLQECEGIFLKICLEQVKKDLERNASSNAEIIACLHVYLLKLDGIPIKEIAAKIDKKSRETSKYLSQCQTQLIQHPAIPKECQEWLRNFG
jgi:RNA polymerase sigma factor (sigma-70 family)